MDFNDEYDELSDATFLLDELNPLLSPLGLEDAKALNAGYHDSSQLLYRMAEDILKEFKQETKWKNEPYDSVKHFLFKERLMEESVERLRFSLNDIESVYGKIFNSRIPYLKRSAKKQHENSAKKKKKGKAQISIDDIIEKIQKEPIVLLKSKNIRADHLRALSFLILSRISKIHEHVIVVVDNLTKLFNEGNTRLFLQTIDTKKIEFIFSFNNLESFTKHLKPYITDYYVHRFEKNADIKALEKEGISLKKSPKSIPKKQFEHVAIEPITT